MKSSRSWRKSFAVIRIEHFETVRVSKDGRRIDISLTVSPIRDTSGQIVGASKVARDISRRKTLEARDRFLVELDDALRQHSEAEAITLTAARALGEHLAVNRCAYATVEEDEDTFLLTGNFTERRRQHRRPLYVQAVWRRMSPIDAGRRAVRRGRQRPRSTDYGRGSCIVPDDRHSRGDLRTD